MLGAIAGDVIGSVYEFNSWQGHWQDLPLFSEKSRFTDDTVLTFAVAQSLMECNDDNTLFRQKLVANLQGYVKSYPKAGYGHRFVYWVKSKQQEPYNSYGNGSAMRVSPVGWAFDSLAEVERFSEASADVTHNHPEGIKGACSVAGSIYLARIGKSKNEIRDYVSGKYGYNLNRTIDEIRINYSHVESCQESVPEAIIAFLESENFEESVRKAIWLRGDADTQAAIAGSIAEAFYGGVPDEIANLVLGALDKHLEEVFGKWQIWLKNRKRSGN